MISLCLSKFIKLDNQAKVLSFCYMLRKRQFIINGDPKQLFMFAILINMTSLLNCVPCVVKTCLRANVPYVLTCSRAYLLCVLTCSRANVPCVLTSSLANVPCVLTCSRSNTPCVLKHSRARTMRAYLLTCQCALCDYVLKCQHPLSAYVLTYQRPSSAEVLTCKRAILSNVNSYIIQVLKLYLDLKRGNIGETVEESL